MSGIRPEPPEECAQCGAAIPRQARACPECGADERTGWSETDVYDGLDLSADPATGASPEARRTVSVFWIVVAAGLLVLLVLGALGLRP